MHEISSGRWKPGDPLPSEADIGRQYGLSTGTVRKALAWLETAKLVTREQGRGTFVRDTADLAVAERYMRVRDARGNLPHVEFKVLGFESGSADDAEAKALEIQPGSSVRRARRVNTVGDHPLSFECSVVPARLFKLPDEEAGAFIALPGLAKRCGVLLGKGEERLRLTKANAAVAEQLACALGELVFSYERIVRTLKGEPAEWKRGFGRMPADFYYSVPLGFEEQN